MPKFIKENEKSEKDKEKDTISDFLSDYEKKGDQDSEDPTGDSKEVEKTGEDSKDDGSKKTPEQIQAEYEELKKENERLKSQAQQGGKSEDQMSKKDVEEKIPDEQLEFVTAEEVAEIQKNPAKFNEILARTYQRARQDAIRDVKDVTRNVVRQEQQQQETARKFFDENPDLVQHRDYVGMIANQLANSNPEWTTDKLLQETSREVRKRLNIDEQARSTETKRRDNPAFAAGQGNTGSRQGSSDNRSEQQKQIDALIDI